MILMSNRRKTYEVVNSDEMRMEIEDIENTMKDGENDIFYDDEDSPYKYLKNLDTSERRLFIVYATLDCSIIKTARYFQVDRKTVSNRITEIKDKILNEYGDKHLKQNLSSNC